jgi:DNA-binding NtrC family response regulator
MSLIERHRNQEGEGLMGQRQTPTVLVVGDGDSSAELRRALGRSYELMEVQCVVDALVASERRAPTVVVIDPATDEGGGKHLLAAMGDHFPATLRIVYAAASRSELVRMLESGIAHGAMSRAFPAVNLARLIDRSVRLLQVGIATPRGSRRLRRLAIAGALQ